MAVPTNILYEGSPLIYRKCRPCTQCRFQVFFWVTDHPTTKVVSFTVRILFFKLNTILQIEKVSLNE